MTKLAILGTRGIPARYGGFETFAERLADGLTHLGFDVTVFCERGEEPSPDQLRGITLRYTLAPSLGPLKTMLFDIACLWKARREYDVVYMLGYGAAPFCLIPRLCGTEVWLNPDGLEWARAKWGIVAKSYFRLMEWMALRTVDRIIADADAIAENLASRHGNLRSCTVIPYGCEVIERPPSTEPLSQWSVVPGSYYLIVSRLEPENHVLEILLAFQHSKSDRQLIVVGDYLAGTRYAGQLLAVKDSRIKMVGTIFDGALLTCLRYHAFAYFHGHSVGGTNPSLLEAMGCGNLIFAHDNPFNRETLGACGIYFRDAVELAASIDLAESGDEPLMRLREASKERARLHYQWPEVVRSYAELLHRAECTRSAA